MVVWGWRLGSQWLHEDGACASAGQAWPRGHELNVRVGYEWEGIPGELRALSVQCPRMPKVPKGLLVRQGPPGPKCMSVQGPKGPQGPKGISVHRRRVSDLI